MQPNTGKHSIGGIILVILSLVVAIITPMLFGVIGGGVAVVLAVIAILLAVRCVKKGGKGKGVVIISAVSILLAVIMTVTAVAAFTKFKEAVKKYGDAPLVERYLDNPYFGFSGMLMKASKDGSVDLNELNRQLDLLTEHINAEAAAATK